MDIRKFIDKVKKFDSSKKIYEQIGAGSLMEGLKLNGFSINKKHDPDADTFYIQPNVESELNEKIDFEFEDKGGVIVFSVNVNAVELSKNKLVRFIKNNPEIFGVTIGNFVKGRYKAKDGSLYDESSLSVEIVGITSDVLNKVAEELAQEFKQETVLVKNYDENKIYLVNP